MTAAVCHRPDNLATLARHCRVDADGVTAAWVETTAATIGQPTIVYFPAGTGEDSLQGFPVAEYLADVTGARILVVARRRPRHGRCPDDVEDGLRAYAWLLHEGCDVDTTAFFGDAPGAVRAASVLSGAVARGLPVPAAGVWTF